MLCIHNFWVRRLVWLCVCVCPSWLHFVLQTVHWLWGPFTTQAEKHTQTHIHENQVNRQRPTIECHSHTHINSRFSAGLHDEKCQCPGRESSSFCLSASSDPTQKFPGSDTTLALRSVVPVERTSPIARLQRGLKWKWISTSRNANCQTFRGLKKKCVDLHKSVEVCVLFQSCFAHLPHLLSSNEGFRV